MAQHYEGIVDVTMGVKTHISKWGASLAVRIPKPIAEQWGVREGSEIEMASLDGHLVLRKTTRTLAEMLDQITPENLHPEQTAGAPVGIEEW